MKNTIILLGVLNFTLTYAQQDTSGKVGVNTEFPAETLDIKGTAKIQELPKSGEGKVYNGKATKEAVFTGTKTLVADDNGVLGFVDGLPNDTDTKYTAGQGISINDANEISRTGLEEITQEGNKGWRLIGVDPTRYGNIGENALDLSRYIEYNDGKTYGATGRNSTAIGTSITASGAFSTGIGIRANASNFAATAIGQDATASGNSSVAMGSQVKASGNNSVAMGISVIASGAGSVAMGSATEASGPYSTAMGTGIMASGHSSFAVGSGARASGWYSIAMGFGTGASGMASIAMGNGTTASGDYSVAMGNSTKAIESNAVAMGVKTVASGASSFAVGGGTTASGVHSVAMGNETTASGVYTMSVGSRNHEAEDKNNLFMVGNGIIDTTSNAVVVRRDGKTGINLGKDIPTEALEVGGAVKIKDGGYKGLTNGATTPVPNGGAGTIVFQNGHFFGWTGSAWKQLDN